MAHELEIVNGKARAFYGSGTPAWHDLGTVVAHTPSSEEAIKLAGLDNWDVQKRELWLKNAAGEYVVAKDQIAIVRGMDEKVLGYATPKFQTTQNEEAFAFMDALIGEGCKYEAAGSLYGGQRIWILAHMPEDYKIAGDAIRAYMMLTMGHDGHHALTIADTDTRVVCWNTLNFALAEAEKRLWKIKHIGDMDAKMTEAGSVFKFMRKRQEQLTAHAEDMLQIKLTEKRASKLILSLFPDNEKLSDLVRKRNEEKRSLLHRALQAEDLENFRMTGWGFVNAVADYTSHHVPENKVDNEKWRENNLVQIVRGHGLLDKAAKLVAALN